MPEVAAFYAAEVNGGRSPVFPHPHLSLAISFQAYPDSAIKRNLASRTWPLLDHFKH
jgi:hypothetical protein